MKTLLGVLLVGLLAGAGSVAAQGPSRGHQRLLRHTNQSTQMDLHIPLYTTLEIRRTLGEPTPRACTPPRKQENH
jgi:hypothetical protein